MGSASSWTATTSTAGQAWPELLERHLRACRAVAVCLGPEGLGPWQRREQYVALDRKARETHVPGRPRAAARRQGPASGLPAAADLGRPPGGPEDARALEALAKAIRGQPPAEAAEAGVPDPRATICPYRGLEPFREEDAPFFVGREAFTEAMVEKVGQTPILGVVGASGSGKSSVVLAGLVPQLRRSARTAGSGRSG